jgi:transcriptional regulator with PAS, ATPase and Fis domain
VTDELNLRATDLVEVVDRPFVLIDRHYRIVAANARYCQAYATTPEAVVGRRCHEVSHHRDIPCHLAGEDCPHRQVFETGETHEVMHTHFDACGQPERVRIHGHAVRDARGDLLLGESMTPLPDCRNPGTPRLVGQSRRFSRALDELDRAARCDMGVLLLGESGTGKELAAEMLHRQSDRADRPLVTVDCTTLTEPLFESELFGHERGAFTGCAGRRRGLAELADGGTLFLDEIGELGPSMQAKLLRLLETGHFRRLGGHDVMGVDFRIIAATNRDLPAMVERGEFRADLYYRLACIPILLPPLRDRREDIPLLATELLDRINACLDRRCRLSPEALDRLESHDFPGNIRELKNCLQRAAAMCDDGVIHAHDLAIGERNAASQPALDRGDPAGIKSLDAVESEQIGALLERFGGRRREVAQALGVSERTLYRKLRRYRLH